MSRQPYIVVKKEKVIHPETFQPIIRYTFDTTMELEQDLNAVYPDSDAVKMLELLQKFSENETFS